MTLTSVLPDIASDDNLGSLGQESGGTEPPSGDEGQYSDSDVVLIEDTRGQKRQRESADSEDSEAMFSRPHVRSRLLDANVH